MRDHYDFRVFTDAEMRQQVFKRDAAVGLSDSVNLGTPLHFRWG